MPHVFVCGGPKAGQPDVKCGASHGPSRGKISELEVYIRVHDLDTVHTSTPVYPREAGNGSANKVTFQPKNKPASCIPNCPYDLGTMAKSIKILTVLTYRLRSPRLCF